MKSYLSQVPTAELWITNAKTFLNYAKQTNPPLPKVQDNQKQLELFLKHF